MFLIVLSVILVVLIIIDDKIIKNGKQKLKFGKIKYQKYNNFFYRLMFSKKLEEGRKKIHDGEKKLNIIIKISFFLKLGLVVLLLILFVLLSILINNTLNN